MQPLSLRTFVTQLPRSALARDPLAPLPGHLHRSGAGLPELRRTAAELRGDTEILRTSLRLLTDDIDALTAVANRSYTHPNGFTKIVLHLGGGYGVRLHVWYAEPPDYGADTNPHGHRWEFASWIVVGELREEIFVEADTGTRHNRFDYSRRNGRADLHRTGTAALQRVGEIARPAGTVYGRARDKVHTVSPTGRGLVVSLVLQGPTAFEPTLVYQPQERPAHEETRLTPDRLQVVLHDVQAAF